MNIEVNYVAVLVAAIVSMVLGFLWYSPILFGKPWMKLKGYTEESMKNQKGLGGLYTVTFVLALVMAFILAHTMALSQNFYNYTPITTGLSTAFWMWLGFVMPIQAHEEMFGGKKWGLFGITTAYQLVSLLLMGVVIGLM